MLRPRAPAWRAALLCASLLAACAGSPPQHQRQAARTLGLQPASPDEPRWPGTDWWRDWSDAQLERLLDLAMTDAPGLELAAARLREASGTASAAAAALQPTLTLNAAMDRERESGSGLIPPPYRGATIDNARTTLDAGYELDPWGKNRASTSAARRLVQASRADQALVRLVLTTAIIQAYEGYQVDLQRLDIARRAAAQRAALAEVSRRRLREGLDPAVVRTQADGDRAASRLSLAQVETALALDRNQIAALCGVAATGLPELAPRPLPAVPASVPSLSLELLARRPDIAAARARVEAASDQVRVAHAQFYPSISLNGFAGVSTITLSKLLDADSRIASLGPTLRLPLFDGGRLRANAAVTHAVLDEAVAQYNQAIVDAVQQVSDQLATLDGIARQVTQVRAALASAQRVSDLNQARRRAGLLDQSTVLQSQSAVLAQQDVAVLLEGRRLAAYAGLMKALGGGYLDAAASSGAVASSYP